MDFPESCAVAVLGANPGERPTSVRIRSQEMEDVDRFIESLERKVTVTPDVFEETERDRQGVALRLRVMEHVSGSRKEHSVAVA